MMLRVRCCELAGDMLEVYAESGKVVFRAMNDDTVISVHMTAVTATDLGAKIVALLASSAVEVLHDEEV